MILNDEEYIVDIVEVENQKMLNKYDISSLKPLSKPTFKGDVKDSASIFIIDGIEPEDDSIITVSNYQFPNFVNEAVEKTNAAATKLVPRLAKHILRPSTTGYYGIQSYAFWPRHTAISKKKILKRVQLQTIHNRVFQWLCDVTITSQLPVESDEELTSQYIAPLTYLIDQDFVPSAIKRIASDTLRLVETNDFRPVSILQHGDFWYGNVLLERNWPFSLKSPISFFIIDWAGVNIHGYPYIDQLRYLMSVSQRNRVIAHNLFRYSNACDLPMRDILNYACCYAGYLGMNRNEFPLERYLKLIDTLILQASSFSNRVSPKLN